MLEHMGDVRYNVHINVHYNFHFMHRMNSKNTLPITEARKRIFELAEKTQKGKAVFFLTQNGKAKAVMMSVEEYESWQDTIGIVTDKELAKDILAADKSYEKGDRVSLEDVLKEYGYVAVNNQLKKKNVQNGTHKKGKKRPGKAR